MRFFDLRGGGIVSLVGFFLLLLCLQPRNLQAKACIAPAGWETFAFSSEVRRDEDFRQVVPGGLEFALIANDFGWSIRIFGADALDLSALTPPFHGSNARDIEGWHFRNAANDGPNEGSINAPQRHRAFSFALNAGELVRGIGRGPGPEAGIGWLDIDEMALQGLQTGRWAYFASMAFTACLQWPRSRSLASCGLPTPHYQIIAGFDPLRVDLDGDGVTELAALLHQQSDGAGVIGICPQSQRFELFGLAGEFEAEGLIEGFLASLEAWRAEPLGGVRLGYEGEPDPPRSDGDRIILERIEKSMARFYFEGGVYRVQKIYRFVEP